MWEFHTTFEWQPEADEQGRCGLRDGKDVITVTPPASLGGKAGYWTPEDLLVSSIESCMFLTTMSVVKKQKIDLKAYRSSAAGQMEKTPNGLRITGMTIRVTAQLGADTELQRFQQAVATAERYCPVLAAVNFPVKVELLRG